MHERNTQRVCGRSVCAISTIFHGVIPSTYHSHAANTRRSMMLLSQSATTCTLSIMGRQMRRIGVTPAEQTRLLAAVGREWALDHTLIHSTSIRDVLRHFCQTQNVIWRCHTATGGEVGDRAGSALPKQLGRVGPAPLVPCRIASPNHVLRPAKRTQDVPSR